MPAIPSRLLQNGGLRVAWYCKLFEVCGAGTRVQLTFQHDDLRNAMTLTQ
jgi:hypothetical protein